MNKICGILLIGLFLISCKQKTTKDEIADKKVEFNQALADELKKMAEIDQVAAYIRQGEYEHLSKEQWKSFKDSVFTTNQKRAREMFEEYGFVGFNLAGEEGSEDFWLIVQHSDHNPDFQKEILEKMKIEVDKGNADSQEYGLLVDRVKLNTGQEQVYGTQVAYNMEICQAYPKNLIDSINVNLRRKEIGLKPIEEYLNHMTKSHFKMNKDYYSKTGITEPRLYKIE
ncbi:hypothetical protein HNS40_20490 [Lentimicrobium sp. S6]|nr:hypothetical protein [Lentimicrobium sp. S6]